MAYESYALTLNSNPSAKSEYLDMKKAQVDFLFKNAIDREDNCTLNGLPFVDSPRIFNRKVKTNYFQTASIETINSQDDFRAGDIISYDGDNWICTSEFVFHSLYRKGEMYRCNYVLQWQDKTTLELKSSPAFTQSASQYNSGEEGTKTVMLGYNQYMIVLPSNEDTNSITRTHRFFINRQGINETVYRVTRNDVIPYSDWDDGCICLIVTEDQYNPDTDDKNLMICDYVDPTPSPVEDINISCNGKPQIRIGGSKKTFIADTSSDLVIWSMEGTALQQNKIVLTTMPDTCKCKVNCLTDDLLVNTKFLLKCVNRQGLMGEIEVEITGGV